MMRGRGATWLTLLLCLPCHAVAQQQVHGGELPSVSPDGRLIAYLSDRTGTDEIYVIAADGGTERQLTHGGAGRPWWSPNGKSILFAGLGADSGRVTAMALDGSARRLIATVPGRSPVLSPDGKLVAFLRGPWTATETVVAGVDGSAPHSVAGGHGTTAWNGVWSPDGRRLAYSYGDSSRHLQVHVVNTDGSGDRAVTHALAADGSAQMPAWSADGKQLAIQVSNPKVAHVWIVDLDSGQATRLAAHAEPILDEVPAWFPDRKHFAFQSTRSGRTEIWVMNADGSGLRQVTGVAH